MAHAFFLVLLMPLVQLFTFVSFGGAGCGGAQSIQHFQKMQEMHRLSSWKAHIQLAYDPSSPAKGGSAMCPLPTTVCYCIFIYIYVSVCVCTYIYWVRPVPCLLPCAIIYIYIGSVLCPLSTALYIYDVVMLYYYFLHQWLDLILWRFLRMF